MWPATIVVPNTGNNKAYSEAVHGSQLPPNGPCDVANVQARTYVEATPSQLTNYDSTPLNCCPVPVDSDRKRTYYLLIGLLLAGVVIMMLTVISATIIYVQREFIV